MSRNPNNLIKPELFDSDTQDISIKEVPDFLFEDFDRDNEKEVGKFIFRVEKVCRNSYEYKSFISFLKEYGNLNDCSFFAHIHGADSRDIKIELHHEPITLYDIASIVFKKRIRNNECIHEDMIAKEVMYNHYKLHCGLIPLSTTTHEMVHNQFLFIPSFAVLGKWQEFIKEYKDYVPIDTLSNIETILEHSKHYNFEEETEILNPGFISVNVDDPEYQASTQELYDTIKSVLDTIDSGKK